MFHVYIGWDPLDILAYEKTEKSLLKHASIPVKTIPLRDIELRVQKLYWREYRVDRNGQRWDLRDNIPFTTEFTYTRYLTPLLYQKARANNPKWCLFTDPDILWRTDIKELIDLFDDSKAVMVVKHDHTPNEKEKMGKLIQTQYSRKNWTSIIAFNIDKIREINLTLYRVNIESKDSLHQMTWVDDDFIGELPVEWNWLEGYSDPLIDPKIVHYTRGTPNLIDGQLDYEEEWYNV